MKMSRRTLACAIGAAAALMLGGCSTPAPTAAATSSAATPIATPITTVISSIDTLADLTEVDWRGTDSTGNPMNITFYDDASMDEETGGDTLKLKDAWSLSGDTVTFAVPREAPLDVWTYVGTFDAKTQVLSLTFTSSNDHTSGTATLTPVPTVAR